MRTLQHTNPPARPTSAATPRARRRGTGYVLVISTAMMLSVIGFAAIINARVTTRMAVGSNSWAEAGALASSAVECALARISDTPDWREQWTSGAAQPSIDAAKGSMTFAVVDTDGDLADSVQDSVRVYGVGKVGDATRVCAVTLQPAGRQGLDVLRTALHADGNMAVNASPLNVSDGPLSCNARITNNNVTNGDVESTFLTNNGTINGDVLVPAPVKDMPSADVFDTYAAEATVITHSGFWNFKINNALLSPASNPYGAPNPGGMYVITVPPGCWFGVKDVRLWGTLLIRLQGGSNLEVKDVILESYQANQPVLIVDCQDAGSYVYFKLDGGLLSEPTLLFNLNPVGSPFNGESDDDTLDEYAQGINGLVHVIRPPGDTSNKTEFDVSYDLNGPFILDGQVQLDEAPITANLSIYNDPPLGYEVPTHMEAVPGSWQWESLPITGVTGL